MNNQNVTQGERELKSSQKGAIVWLTGYSGAGKTTLGAGLTRKLYESHFSAYMLDGDQVRQGLNSDLDFSSEDRSENIRRIGEVAKLFADAGFLTVVAFISPFREGRDRVRAGVPQGRFVEVFVDCSLEVCEERDTKGLYKKARSGDLKEFTGISSPYENPLCPEVHLRTDEMGIDECVDKIIGHMVGAKIIKEAKPEVQ
ncbi:MAG: adenylyl-sulfate kinase [Nitrospinae bacterium]|nr:adenylyl-sulfate kinase [Nitrospinota bacterium]